MTAHICAQLTRITAFPLLTPVAEIFPGSVHLPILPHLQTSKPAPGSVRFVRKYCCLELVNSSSNALSLRA